MDKTEEHKLIAKLNQLCFGEEDIYSCPVHVAGCHTYVVYDKAPEKHTPGDPLKIIAYALFKPGKIASLERYGVHPEHQGQGLGARLLQKSLENYRVVWTYSSGTNPASIAVMQKVGFMLSGAGGDWVYLLYISPEYKNRSCG